MGIMLSINFSPVILCPSREITAEMAQPDGILTCPSFIIAHSSFPENKKGKGAAEGKTPHSVNALAHYRGIIPLYGSFVNGGRKKF